MVGFLLVAAATVLPLFRQTGTRSWQTVWAEDGQIYFKQATQSGGAGVLFRSYAGYEQLPPRILAAFSTLVPIRQVSVYMAVSSVLVAALLALFLYTYSAGWITSRYVRLALASLLVLMPATGSENTANITNTIWLFAAVAPWALISFRARPYDLAIRSTVVFLAATATTVSLLFLPLALGYALVRKSRETWLVASAFFGGCIIQTWVMLHAHYHYPLSGHPSDSLLVRATAAKVFALFLVGNRGEEARVGEGISSLLIIAAIICLVVIAVLLVGASRSSQTLALVLVAFAAITFAAPVWYRHATVLGLTTVPGRYSVVPVIMLGSAVAVLVAPADRSRNRTIARIGRPVFAAYVLVLVVSNFSVSNIRSVAPTWAASLSQTYREDCVGASPDKVVEIPTQRANYFFGKASWAVSLPCRDLVS
jgi:hypothetical protein